MQPAWALSWASPFYCQRRAQNPKDRSWTKPPRTPPPDACPGRPDALTPPPALSPPPGSQAQGCPTELWAPLPSYFSRTLQCLELLQQ
ncbi:unnamed protein product [Pipistrellus nathusii]|uniref:Uncharacterized protein n=1 Tax=Pipistrellus nathusii TaxID=59473 RepID=A0ABP0ACU9_PIPNA